MKSHIRVLIFTMALLAAMVPAILWAQGTPGNTNYVVLKMGGFIPQSSDLDKENAETGFSGQLAFGYYLNQYFSLDAAIGYFETKGRIGDVNTKAGVIPLEIAGRFGLPIGIWEPYLAVGVGGYHVRSEVGQGDKESYRAGLFGGGGVNLNLTKTFFIGAEARYLFLGGSTSSGADIEINGVIATGNVGFRF